MALFQCTFRSQVIGTDVPFNVIIPEHCKEDIPIVLLLHGHGGNQDHWLRNTPIERYAKTYGMAMVMPYGQKSWFCDMKYGDKYYTYITQELMEYVRTIFPVSKKREKTFVAGLSMGGYGALKIALAESDRFAACGALSGAVDLHARFALGNRHEDGVSIWGENYLDVIPGSVDDTYELTRRLEAEGRPKPWIYQACGTEDKRLHENHLFRDFIQDRGYVYEYFEGPGIHDWTFWNTHILKALDFFQRCMAENQ